MGQYRRWTYFCSLEQGGSAGRKRVPGVYQVCRIGGIPELSRRPVDEIIGPATAFRYQPEGAAVRRDWRRQAPWRVRAIAHCWWRSGELLAQLAQQLMAILRDALAAHRKCVVLDKELYEVWRRWRLLHAQHMLGLGDRVIEGVVLRSAACHRYMGMPGFDRAEAARVPELPWQLYAGPPVALGQQYRIKRRTITPDPDVFERGAFGGQPVAEVQQCAADVLLLSTGHSLLCGRTLGEPPFERIDLDGAALVDGGLQIYRRVEARAQRSGADIECHGAD